MHRSIRLEDRAIIEGAFRCYLPGSASAACIYLGLEVFAVGESLKAFGSLGRCLSAYLRLSGADVN
jgi:hypothetical protein